MKCENCGHYVKQKRIARVCSNLVAYGKKNEGKRSSKKVPDKKKEVFNEIRNFCIENRGLQLKVNTTFFLNKLGIEGFSEGDTLRIILDKLVCEGILSKIKFSNRGHTYVINNNFNKCEFYIEGDIFPVCVASKSEFKPLDLEKEEC